MEPYSSTDIVIPTFNESATVEELVRRLRESCPGATLIFVDNGSTDATLEILETQGELELIRHDRNIVNVAHAQLIAHELDVPTEERDSIHL